MYHEIKIVRSPEENPDYDNFRKLANVYDDQELKQLTKDHVKGNHKGLAVMAAGVALTILGLVGTQRTDDNLKETLAGVTALGGVIMLGQGIVNAEVDGNIARVFDEELSRRKTQ